MSLVAEVFVDSYRKDTHMKLFCVCGRITKIKPPAEILLRKVLFFYD